MAVPFLSGATGDPINTKRQIAQQAVRGIPAVSGLVDFRAHGGPVRMSPQEVIRLMVNAGGAPAGNLPGKIPLEGGPFEMGDVDPANLGYLQMLANVFGHYDVNTVAGVEQWEFALDGGTAAAPFLTYREDNDVLPRFRVTDMLFGGFTMSAEPNGNMAATFPWVAADFDFHGAVTQETGTASTLPILKRTWGDPVSDTGNWAADATDQDIYVKVTSIAALPVSVTVQVKVGAAAAYSNSQEIRLGKWERLYDEAGLRLGTVGEQVVLYWPVGATLVALDEFLIEKRVAATWSQTLAVDRPIAAVNTLFMLDGDEIRMEGGWQIEANWQNLNRFDDVAGKQGATVERSGEFQVRITPTRRLVDLTLQSAIMGASEVSVVIDGVTDVLIGATTKPYRCLVIAPACRAFGSTYGVEAGAQNKEESVELVARVPEATFEFEDYEVDTHLKVILENDVAAL